LHRRHSPTLENDLASHGWNERTVSAPANDSVRLHPTKRAPDFFPRKSLTNQSPESCRPKRKWQAGRLVGVTVLTMPVVNYTCNLQDRKSTRLNSSHLV